MITSNFLRLLTTSFLITTPCSEKKGQKIARELFWELKRIDHLPLHRNYYPFITYTPLEYGSVLARCQPVLRAWSLETAGSQRLEQIPV